MEKRNKLLIATSLMTLLAAGGVTLGVTTALFTSQGSASVHINAGNLNVGFYLKNLEFDQLNPTTGDIEKSVDINLKTTTPYSSAWNETESAVDLAKFTGNVITADKFYPTMKGSAKFLVVNNSEIAIYSKLSKTLSGTFAPVAPATEGVTMSDDELKQLDISFSWLDDQGDSITDESVKILKSGRKYALLTFEFKNTDTDGSNDNKYQGCKFEIDTVLTATQIVRSEN